MSHKARTNDRGQSRRSGSGSTIRPATRYRVEMQDGKLAIRPMTEAERQAYEAMTPEQRVKRFLEWANQPRPETPILPDEAFRRENLYD